MLEVTIGDLGRSGQRCDAVQQAFVPTVYYEAEMWEKVGTDVGLFGVGHHKSPREIPA
jgi:hypothetical protein